MNHCVERYGMYLLSSDGKHLGLLVQYRIFIHSYLQLTQKSFTIKGNTKERHCEQVT